MSLIDIVKKFKDAKITVVGDLMLDEYITGEVDRISPEAPVPVVLVNSPHKYIPGGAANVAANIASFGAKCYISGVVGKDEARGVLDEELARRHINTTGIVTDRSRITTVKQRIIGNGQQMLRLDYETKKDVKKVKEIFSNLVLSDILVVSDYAKGVITKELMDELRKTGKKLIVDPKPEHRDYYNHVFAITPNEKEAYELVRLQGKPSFDEVGRYLAKTLETNVLMTRGPHGMALFGKEYLDIPSHAKEVFDVTGAGDTSIAVFSLALATGCSLSDATILANYAGGIKVGKRGTAVVTEDELIAAIKSDIR